MKKLIVAFCLVFAVMLAGCAATPEIPTSSPVEAAQATPEAVTLFDTATLKIVLEGAETTITDKTTGTEYGYTTTRKLTTQQPTLEQMQARCIARTSANTDTVKIELAGALIVVTDKATGQVYYIDP
ncbi:hypothetical protein B5G34_05760 [Flavonifractor sp. An82]|uniref:hypothetical protein n=1 Tax=Flavonifractor sp. An82 TaxID=1965660 RepID=UPI000B39540E|nr:hypothetical protein [Flavonifractor sp. An82]OUN22905.1 hypothetical protein B5G34_05760 [Flavonifractor sp. An82]